MNKCAICGVPINNPVYYRNVSKDVCAGPGEEKVYFCGAKHSLQWYQENVEQCNSKRRDDNSNI